MKKNRPSIIQQSVDHIRDSIYTSWKLAKTVGMNHGVNLSGIDAIRGIDESLNGRKLLWMASSVQKVMRQEEQQMVNEIDSTVIKEEHQDKVVDGIKFDIEQLFIYIIKHFSLEQKVHTGTVEIGITVDGAELEPNAHHVTIGFKLCDKYSINPKTGEQIFNGGEDSIQPDRWCFQIMMRTAKDKKITYNHFFREVFALCTKMRKYGLTSIGWKPFAIPEPQDKKSTQICLKRGGADT
jgi:hypothetical protein